MKKIDLGGRWRLCRGGEVISETARVPGSIYGAMLDGGLLPEPYAEDNPAVFCAAMEEEYSFSRSFDVGSADGMTLCCEGLDTLCDIYINGTHIAATDNMFRTYRFDVSGVLVPGENTVRIDVHSPTKFLREKYAENPLKAFGGAEKGYGHLRKAHSMLGWDWAPDMPDGGIWRSIYLENASDGALREVFVKQRHSDGAVTLEVSAVIENCADGDAVRIDFDGKSYEFAAENGGFSAEIAVGEPKLWYPAGMGAQYLYDFKMTLADGENERDSYSCRIGLRTVEVVSERDSFGKSFYFVVNSLPVFAKGTNYVMEDNILPQGDSARTRRLLTAARDTNQNMIRVWGGSFYGSDDFYDICDELGLLVWQDFMFSCTCYPGDAAFYDNVYREARDNIIRLRNHASLALWCGNNECEVSVGVWKTLPYTKADERDCLILFESVISRAAAEFDPTRYYHPSSPSAGGAFENAASLSFGDCHDWSMWFDFADFDEAEKRLPRFASEFGFVCPPPAETLEKYVKRGGLAPTSASLEKFIYDNDGIPKLLFYLAREFDFPTDFPRFCYMTQVLSTIHCGRYIEHMRRNRNGMLCMGALYWQLNDCAPALSCAAVDYEGRYKAMMYKLKNAFAPILVSVDMRANPPRLHVTNDTPEKICADVYWAVRDNYGKIYAGAETKAEVMPLSDRAVSELDISEAEKAPAARYIEYGVIESGERRPTGVRLLCRNKEYDYPKPEIEYTIRETADGCEVELMSRVFANYVELSANDAGAVFDDNYFALAANERRIIRTRDKIGEVKIRTIYAGRDEL